MLERLAGTATVVRALTAQRGFHQLPPERIAAARDRRVREIVAFAVQHVPFYRDHFRAESIDPREIRCADDLCALPLLDKVVVQRELERFRPDPAARGETVAFPSAGSTGAPLTVFHDRRSLLETIAWGERERIVEAKACGRRYGYDVLQISHPLTADRRARAYSGRISYRPLRPRLHTATVEDPLGELLATLNRLRPPVVRGFGTHLDLLFQTAVARGRPFHRPRVVVYGGDALPREGKRLLEDELGIAVHSRYGASEAFKIGFTCEARRGFHLHEDLTDVRTIRADASAATAGEEGEVVISNLVNRGLVLLNYRLGDLARLGGRGCACGRTTRLLDGLEGRVSELLRLPDGTIVHPVLVRLALTPLGVLRFQLRQTGAASYLLRLVVGEPHRFDELARAATAALAPVLPECRIEVERHEHLAPDPGRRKFRAVVPLHDGEAVAAEPAVAPRHAR